MTEIVVADNGTVTDDVEGLDVLLHQLCEYFLKKVKIISAGLKRPMLYLNFCWGYPLMTVVLFELIVHMFSLRLTQQQVKYHHGPYPTQFNHALSQL